MIHALTHVLDLPNGFRRYRCDACCGWFRARGDVPQVDGCPGEGYVPTEPGPTILPTPAISPPSGGAQLAPDGSAWLANGGPVATQAEQKRRMLICNRCDRLNDCAPTICIKRKLWETGSCNEWTLPAQDIPTPEAEQYRIFLAEWPGYVRTSGTLAVSKAPPRPHTTRLYAILSTWHEGDIVEAAVRNLWAEGCDRVYLLDNDSPDGSALAAVKAGAILARSYKTDYFQDVLRCRLLNGIMQDVTESEAHPELWWLCLDCDEFPRGPGAMTVRQYVASLPPDCNTVGAVAFDHYPTDKIANVPGKHPANCQPFGWLRDWPNKGFCPQGHWKHPLIRYLDGRYTAIQTRGLHEAYITAEHGPPVEPATPLLHHHFMFRNESDTRRRLTALCGPDPRIAGRNRSLPDDTWIDGEGAMTRFKSLDLIYTQQWDKARMSHMQSTPELRGGGIPAKHWREWFAEADYVPRIP
jgi:hypothetical protein